MHMASMRTNTIQWQNKQTGVNNWNGKITNLQHVRTNRETNPTSTHGNKFYKMMKKNMYTHKMIDMYSPFQRNSGQNFVQTPQGVQEGTLFKGTVASSVQRGSIEPIAQLECPPQMKKKKEGPLERAIGP